MWLYETVSVNVLEASLHMHTERHSRQVKQHTSKTDSFNMHRVFTANDLIYVPTNTSRFRRQK